MHSNKTLKKSFENIVNTSYKNNKIRNPRNNNINNNNNNNNKKLIIILIIITIIII